MNREQALKLLNNDVLFDRIIKYNCQKHDEVVDKLIKSPIYSSYASMCNEALGLCIKRLAKYEFTVFESNVSKLLLLSEEKFNKLVCFLGIAAFSHIVGAFVSNSDINKAKALLNEDGYSFAMNYARFTIQDSLTLKDAELTLDNIKKEGCKLLLAFLDSFDNDTLKEEFIKKVKSVCIETEDLNVSFNKEKLFKLVRFILINEIDGKWKDYLD